MTACTQPTRSPPGWTISGLRAERAEATLDLGAAEAGLRLTATGDRLFGVDLAVPETGAAGPPLSPADLWVRGDDLVAVYEPADLRQLRATAMWRRRTSPHPAWELVLSAQTAQLESDSRIAVISDLATGHVSWGRCAQGHVTWNPLAAGSACPAEAECLWIERARDAVVLAVHPADARRIDLVAGEARLRIVCQLFPAEIEKGVLLRSRVRAAVGPCGDARWASEFVAAFAAEPPPLTT